MKRIRKIIPASLFYIIVALLVSGCSKEDSYFGPYFKGTINGVKYRDQESRFSFNPSGAKGGPLVWYELKDDKGYFLFQTQCSSESKKTLPAYFINCYLYIDSPLVIGKQYKMSTLPGLDYYVFYQDAKLYEDSRHSFCQISKVSSASEYLFFGTGYIELSKIDKDTHLLEGKLILEVPYPDDNKENDRTILNIEGNFQCNGVFIFK